MNIELVSRYGMRTEEFSALMKHRVLDILLVASHYDAFVLEEDGQLTELVFEEYRNLDLNLRYAPRFTRTANAREALEMVRERSFDMVVTTPHVLEMNTGCFVERLREERPDLPLGLLAAHAWDLPWLEDLRGDGGVDLMFLWQGNVRALLAMIKQVEDRMNADHDILEGGVQAIILVEDEVRFYSAYLPHIYTEVTTQTSRLMADGLNLSHRLLRIRARPKILLAQTYEEAWAYYERYQGNLLGIITDVGYPKAGRREETAGLSLAAAVREREEDLPILAVSLDGSFAPRAEETGATFLCKGSGSFLEDLRRYILDRFGFGDFVFRLPDGTVLDRASDMRELVHRIADAPQESLLFHAGRNHFSAWLKARTEFELASMLRPRKASEFSSGADLRSYLVETLTTYLRTLQRHVIADFDSDRYDEFVAFARIGSGSLGGKGRGLAFMHKLLARDELDLPGVEIVVPQTVVLATDVFEEFLDRNDLRNAVADDDPRSDDEILDRFRATRIPPEVRTDLARFLDVVRDPLAVRSSSLLEDSVYQPFAGVYATVMLPNSHPSLDVRLAQLLEAIKVVYASTYFRQAREYLASTPYRIEEELMAVLVQRLVGSRNRDCFYPTLAGVASSYNFYPFQSMRPEDGVVQLVLGLGKSVAEGFNALRFCPRHPQVLPQMSAVKDVLRNAQRCYYALDMVRGDVIPGADVDVNLVRRDAVEAVEDECAASVFSTYLRADDRVSAGILDGGVPLVTFAPLLKSLVLPLPEILERLLRTCERGIASPVEIEFAADLRAGLGRKQSFHVLQLRPLVVEAVNDQMDLDPEVVGPARVRSSAALGHGRSDTIHHVILADPRRLRRADTARAAAAIEGFNRRLRSEGRHCLLIGPGRWGSRDPWLGIPVAWPQISTARAIVETDFPDLQVEPSLGSHFFHNLTCFRVAFLAVHDSHEGGWVDWEWFTGRAVEAEDVDGAVRLLRLDAPLQILVDGATGRGAVVEAPAQAPIP